VAVVSIIIPVVREDKAARCIEAIMQDPAYSPATVEIVSDVDHERIGCPRMVERLTAHASHDYVMFLGDDCIPQPGFIQAALNAMLVLPAGWGVVGLNTTPGNDRAHWMAHKRMLEHIPGGAFFSTEYAHCYGDDELKDIAQDLGRWAFAKDAIIEHDHPINGANADEHYVRVYADGVKAHDRATYFRRKRERYGFKVAIGFPLVDANIPVPFFTSFACMEKGSSYTLLVPQFPHGPWSGSIADARNSLVEQALQDGCSHLLMLDTDQTYPPNTLAKLLSHQVDVCGVRVHRRYPPFDVILYRGQVGRYKHVPDAECFSGDLVEVDATGTGCLLFDMRVFDRVAHPWFKLDIHDGKPVGEDIYFCNKARQTGVRIFVDTSIEVGHLALHEVGRGTYEIYKATTNFKWAEV
jgi:hypothetical protein